VAASIRQKVRQDDPLLVIEAMKMQTTIGAPVDGTVDAVHVMPGQLVKTGQPLCTLV
jgi:pyruvate carboxylase